MEEKEEAKLVEEVCAVPHAAQVQVAAGRHGREGDMREAHSHALQQVLQHGELVELHEAVAQVAVHRIHVAGVGPVRVVHGREGQSLITHAQRRQQLCGLQDSREHYRLQYDDYYRMKLPYERRPTSEQNSEGKPCAACGSTRAGNLLRESASLSAELFSPTAERSCGRAGSPAGPAESPTTSTDSKRGEIWFRRG